MRKMSFGEGVERVFPLYSPIIESITVVRRGVVRRAKLYYLRGRTGKSARIAERKVQRAQGVRLFQPANSKGGSGKGRPFALRLLPFGFAIARSMSTPPRWCAMTR